MTEALGAAPKPGVVNGYFDRLADLIAFGILIARADLAHAGLQERWEVEPEGLGLMTEPFNWLASTAQQLGLIDGIESFDEALAAAAQLRPVRRAATHNRAHALRAAWKDVAEC